LFNNNNNNTPSSTVNSFIFSPNIRVKSPFSAGVIELGLFSLHFSIQFNSSHTYSNFIFILVLDYDFFYIVFNNYDFFYWNCFTFTIFLTVKLKFKRMILHYI
jgi:hypothetical protein